MHDVITIDCNYIDKGVAASFLLPQKNHSILIESNTGFAAEIISNEIQKQKLKVEDIRYLIVTHIHLDHAAGSGHLMDLFPNAELICHPAAERHLKNPERLIRSAKMVYGEERFNALYGDIIPVDEKRIRVVEDRSFIDAGSRRLTFYHTEGHARHHICIHDSLSNGVFTGDSFGLVYPLLQKNGLMIYPATTAIDFDPDEARKSIDTILATGADRLYLTHFGKLENIKDAKKELLLGLDFAEDTLNRAFQSEMDDQGIQDFCYKEFSNYIEGYLNRLGLKLSEYERKILDIDIEINAGGIAYAAIKKRKKSAK
ncbi:MAG: MBL fold metallo-hydrolase [Spirochaetia bacterium]|nr:MBL fold metallo-hydrolase [Spirochaetia bacterium]